MNVMTRLLALVFFMALGGCQLFKSDTEIYTPSTFPILTAFGYAPIETQQSASHAEKVMMAMQASKVLAYRELAEQIYGLQLDSNTKLQEWMVQTNVSRTKVTGLIKGAKVVKTYPAGEFYVTELELDFRLVWELYQQTNIPRENRALVIEPTQNF